MTHEQKIEKILTELGLTAPRITPEMIDELMGQVTYSTSVISGTTTTLATAIDAAGFTLCTISSACASPENFNPALGIEIAITKARAAAREKLLELEGYRLKRALHDARLNSSTKALEQIRAVLATSHDPSVEAGHACPPDYALLAKRTQLLSISLGATAKELLEGTVKPVSVKVAEAALHGVELAGGYGATAQRQAAARQRRQAAANAVGTRCSAACNCSRHRPA